jgi:hypothetical protein
MSNNPERLAWVVLLSSFFVCVALGVMTPLSARWYIRHAQVDQQVHLEVQRGPLSVIHGGRGRPRSVFEDSDDIPAGSRITAPNATSGRVVIEAPQSESQAPIATVQLYDETEIVLSSARSPQFSNSRLPHEISLEVEAGRVRLNVFGDTDRSTVVEVHTPQGLVTLEEGSYEVKINSTTEATVRYGRANVICNSGDALSLGPRERALMDVDSVNGPLPAARNLVQNGDFTEPLENRWDSYAEQTDPELPPGEVQIVTRLVGNEEKAVAEFSRDAVNHAEVGITQEIDYDVRDFASLELNMAVNVVSESMTEEGYGGCGYLASECPVIVRIDYRDIHGTDRQWLHGFYVGEPAPDWDIKGWQEKLEAGTWQPYSSGNLMNELNSTPPAMVQSVTIYASGHSFDAMVTEVELLAQE